MKKRILYISTVIFLVIALCIGLAACSVDTSKVAGVYELIELNESEINYKDIVFCNLILDAHGQYILEYKLSDSSAPSEKISEKGKFAIEDNIIEFKEGSLNGAYEVQIKRFRVDIVIDGKQAKALFVYSDNL